MRYAIVDEAMLNEGAAKLAVLHEATRNAVGRAVPITTNTKIAKSQLPPAEPVA